MDQTVIFDNDNNEELSKSYERAKKIASKKQEALAKTFLESIASLATSHANDSTLQDNSSSVYGESQENKVVFTEMEEFVWGLQLHKGKNPRGDVIIMEEDVLPKLSDGRTTVKKTNAEASLRKGEGTKITLDEMIHEEPLGNGLSGALKFTRGRGALKGDIEWSGRNMDKKKSKLERRRGDQGGENEIRIERTDEYGRILTPKEAFRLESHKFHGRGPGKRKKEKRMWEYQEELKIKKMKNSDAPSLSVERMREALAQSKAPYLVLSGHIKPGQTSDPRSGFCYG